MLISILMAVKCNLAARRLRCYSITCRFLQPVSTESEMSFLIGTSKEREVKFIIAFSVIHKAICSHGRSYIYFTESLVSAVANNCSFWAHNWNRTSKQLSQIIAKPCNINICTEMGIRAEIYNQRGCFFLSTANTYPFCGKYYLYLCQIIQFIFRMTLSCYSQQHRSSRR